MSTSKTAVTGLVALWLVLSAAPARAFDMTGGPTWAARNGPGLSFSLGIQGCTQDFCDDRWDTGASIGATVGFFYQIISNAVVFLDFHVGHIPTDADQRYFDIDHDNAMALQLTVGAEFHLPVTDWVAPYLGFGIGYGYLGIWGEIDRLRDDRSVHESLHGVDFQLRLGADFYPFVRVSNLSIGPALFVSFPAWATYCYDVEDAGDDCEEMDDAEDVVGDLDDANDRPVIVYFGVFGRYHF